MVDHNRLSALIKRVQPHLVVTSSHVLQKHRHALNTTAILTFHPIQRDSHELNCELIHRHRLDSPSRPTDVRAIFFTSGTTGAAKGVCLTERSILAAAHMMIDFMRFTPERKTVVTPPLYDYYGFIQMPAHLLAGASIVVGQNSFSPKDIGEAIRSHRATDIALVPYVLRRILDYAHMERHSTFAHIRHLQSSSDVLDAVTVNRAFSISPALSIYDIYGLTEAGRACCKIIKKGDQLDGTIGAPSTGVRIRLDAPNHDEGEIIISGPNVMGGYLDAIVDDEIRFEPASEVRTGDIGRFDNFGNISLLGRRDHLLNLHGQKIHPREIEAAALSCSLVLDARARLGFDRKGIKGIHLDVVAEDASALDALRKHLNHTLQSAFMPVAISVVERIERTELGSKIVRHVSLQE
jgi:acyl-CoA synthetase (AMP-forming)/AMP-acid ligase II